MMTPFILRMMSPCMSRVNRSLSPTRLQTKHSTHWHAWGANSISEEGVLHWALHHPPGATTAGRAAALSVHQRWLPRANEQHCTHIAANSALFKLMQASSRLQSDCCLGRHGNSQSIAWFVDRGKWRSLSNALPLQVRQRVQHRSAAARQAD